jgi:hypothetical protein
MSRHRFSDLISSDPLPELVAAHSGLSPRGFMACPMALQMSAWQVQLYQWAFAEAQAVVRPSVLETRFAPSRN